MAIIKKLLVLLFLFSLCLPTQASMNLACFENDSLPSKKNKKGRLVFQPRHDYQRMKRVPLHRRFYISVQNRDVIYGKFVGFSGDTLLIKDVKYHIISKIPIQQVSYIRRESKFLQKLVENTWFCLLAIPLGIIALPFAVSRDEYGGLSTIAILIAIGGIPITLRELFKMDYDLRNDWYLTIKK